MGTETSRSADELKNFTGYYFTIHETRFTAWTYHPIRKREKKRFKIGNLRKNSLLASRVFSKLLAELSWQNQRMKITLECFV
jgi:hypothetical protein